MKFGQKVIQPEIDSVLRSHVNEIRRSADEHYDAIVDFASEEYVQHVIESYVAAYASLQGYDADYILEEILCDYEAWMNIFSKESIPDSFWEMSQEVLQSDAVKQDAVRGPPDSGKASSEYWRPNLTKAEWSLLNQTMDREIETSDKHIDEATKWLYVHSKGQKVFAIYGIGDGTVPTPLYAVGWKKADADYKKLQDFMEVGDDGIDTNGIRFGKGLKIVPNEQGKTSFSVYANGRRISASEVDSVSVGTSTSNRAGNTGSSTENSSEEIKFSREFVSAQMTEQEKYLQKVNKQIEKENAKLQEDNPYLKASTFRSRLVFTFPIFPGKRHERCLRQIKRGERVAAIGR